MEAFNYVLVALFGAIFGSFATVLCYRIPREIPLGLFSHQRSRCPQCDTQIAWYHNLPLVSYISLRGRCAACGKPIPRRYFLIELTTTVAFVATYWVCVHAVDPPLDNVAFWGDIAKNLAFTLALVSTVFIDIEFRIIPDRFSLGGWVVALLAAALLGRPPFWLALAGGAFGAGSFFLLAFAYEKWKGVEGLGMGDVKMMGWLGTWVGLLGVPLLILSASISGLMAGLIAMRGSKDGLKTAIPFGPFLALGGYLAWALGTLGYI